jgi:hypothetical protein
MRLFPRPGTARKRLAPTWQDNRPTWGEGDRTSRYLHIPQIDRWRAMPFDMPPNPDRGTVLQRVRQIVESLDGAIDEGSGRALDLHIESWVAAWIHTVEVEYADHCAVIDVHRGQASQWLIESMHAAAYESEELDRIRAAYLACRSRLAGEPVAAGQRPDGPADLVRPADPAGRGDSAGLA